MSIQAADLRADVRVTGVAQATAGLETVDVSVRKVGSSSRASAGDAGLLGKSFGGLEHQLKGAVAGFAAFEGVKFLGDVIGDAERTNQEIKTTKVLFGAAADSVIEWSKTTASSMGLSEQATLGMVDSLGTMLKGFGLTGSAAEAMSKNLVQVSVDVGAFKQTDPSVVLAAFQKGLTGAAKGLKSYGVDASAAAQKQEALRLGIAGSAGSWTAAQKAAVFYQLILKGTAQETGAFAARSGDLSEQQKILSAEFANVKDEIGQGLLPTATALFSVFDKGFTVLGPQATETIGRIAGIGLAGSTAVVGVLALGKGFDVVKGAITASSAATASAVAAQEAAAASLAVEATAAEASAVALRDKADSYGLVVSAGGAALGFTEANSAALEGEAVAAETNAAAVRASAVASAEAGVASEGMLAAIGPLGWTAIAAGVAIGGLTAVTSLFGQGQKDAGKSTNDFIDQLLKEGAAASTVANDLVTKYIHDHAQFLPTLKAAGISVDEVSRAIQGSGSAYDDVKTKLGAYRDAQRGATKEVIGQRAASYVTLDAEAKLGGKISEVTGFINKNRTSLHDRTEAQKASTDATNQLASAAANAASKEDQLRAADTNLTSAMVANLDTIRSQEEGILGLVGDTITYRQQLFAVADAQKTWNDDLKAGHGHTEQGQKDLLALQSAQNQLTLGTRTRIDAAEKLAVSQSHVADAEKTLADARKNLTDGKGSQQAVTDATNRLYDAQVKEKAALENNAAFMAGPAKQGALDLAAAINVIPHAKVTAYTTPGLTGATLAAHNYRGELDGIPRQRTTTVTVDAAQALHELAVLDARVQAINPHISLVAVNRAEAGGRASGGYVAPGVTVDVGELGRERLTVFPGGGAYVTSHADVAKQEKVAATPAVKEPMIGVTAEATRRLQQLDTLLRDGSVRDARMTRQSLGPGVTAAAGTPMPGNVKIDINVKVEAGMGAHPSAIGTEVVKALDAWARGNYFTGNIRAAMGL